ncbi:hypothetical protein LOC71_07225 [Rhodopirellula sp. JC740]|uniref:Secreted protein n=1 Tax=Rhodopirellula halodulae TaxID=2894198 RepID=A0ABS8NET2_9BACT|nr:hypothetical protein [Rhodopirellula sp. JC740]MCC9642061.1 hypothetical protein [Rhodopirellula sp. JC740]
MSRILYLAVTLSTCVFAVSAAAENTVKIDGTSHMAEFSRAVIESAERANFLLHCENQESGAGAGLKHFVMKYTDINKMTRELKERERKQCENSDFQFLEILLAHSRDETETFRLLVNRESLTKESVRVFLGHCLSDSVQALADQHAKRLDAAELREARNRFREAIVSTVANAK